MIALGTHVWVWYAAGCDEISPRARQAIEEDALTDAGGGPGHTGRAAAPVPARAQSVVAEEDEIPKINAKLGAHLANFDRNESRGALVICIMNQ